MKQCPHVLLETGGIPSPQQEHEDALGIVSGSKKECSRFPSQAEKR